MSEDVRQEEQFDLRGYLGVLAKRKWLILGFMAVLTAAVGLGTTLQPRVYQAKATLLAGREGPRLLTTDPVPGERIGQRDYLKTQAAILTSRTLLQDAVKSLMKEGFYGSVAPERVEAMSSDLAKELQLRTRALTAEDTQVITVVVEGGIPSRVARTANAIAEQYVESSEEARVAMADQAVTWLESKLAEQKVKLTEAEEDLRSYKQKEHILGPDDADPYAAIGLSRLNDEYLTTRFQRIEKETRLAAMKRSRQTRQGSDRGSRSESLDAEVQRKMRDGLEADYVQAQLDLRNLSQRYGPEHPDIITLKAKVAKIEKELAGLGQPAPRLDATPPVTDAQIADLQAEVSTLSQKERALADALEGHKTEARRMSKTAVGYSLRKQAVALNQQTYNDLLARLNDAQLSSQIRTSAGKILDRAEPPRSPTEPRPVRNLLVAILLGLVLGIGLATLAETLDRRFKSPEEASRYLRLPILTVVPGVDAGGRPAEGRARLVTIDQPRSHAAECYRNLRTSILFSTGRPVPKTILVTSAVGGEGKSTTAANLAAAMTHSGRRVLLIDADLRRPSLQRYFLRRENRGILRALNEQDPPEEAVQSSHVENLDVLLCYGVPGNPSELLGSERMLTLIERFKSQYDVVVIDSPVVVSVPDALILAARAEAVVMVHRPGAAERSMVRHAREKLDEVRANILGLVLNNVDLKTIGYHSPHYLYYGYGIDEREGSRVAGAKEKA